MENFTPFPNLPFSNTDNQGGESGVFMAKAAWDVSRDGRCRLSDEQEPLLFSDSTPERSTRAACARQPTSSPTSRPPTWS